MVRPDARERASQGRAGAENSGAVGRPGGGIGFAGQRRPPGHRARSRGASWAGSGLAVGRPHDELALDGGLARRHRRPRHSRTLAQAGKVREDKAGAAIDRAQRTTEGWPASATISRPSTTKPPPRASQNRTPSGQVRVTRSSSRRVESGAWVENQGVTGWAIARTRFERAELVQRDVGIEGELADQRAADGCWRARRRPRCCRDPGRELVADEFDGLGVVEDIFATRGEAIEVSRGKDQGISEGANGPAQEALLLLGVGRPRRSGDKTDPPGWESGSAGR
jgi:hypothetical protein